MIEWTPDLAVGLKVIDDQHKELYCRINQLMEACNQGKGRETVTDTLNFLEGYIVTHFGNEEQYMRQYAYPDFNEHQRNHAYYINSLTKLKEILALKGPGLELVITTNQVVIEWLTNHIRIMDTKLAAFLKDKL